MSRGTLPDTGGFTARISAPSIPCWKELYLNHLIRVTGRYSLALAALLFTGACDQEAGTLAPAIHGVLVADGDPHTGASAH